MVKSIRTFHDTWRGLITNTNDHKFKCTLILIQQDF
jgi:hypothetical protein